MLFFVFLLEGTSTDFCCCLCVRIRAVLRGGCGCVHAVGGALDDRDC